ncbi:hypothetical protein HDU79_002791 [Rhizoclosmatium sp. JEL0117]|nr:hypothetical protein HDU79_002791 [Rhizoclosmatium sp. JEL0117]
MDRQDFTFDSIDSNTPSIQVSLVIDTGYSGSQFHVEEQGLYLWPSAAPLAKLMVQQPERIKGKRILELGAGVGLTTCVAAKLEPTLLVATDFDSNTLSRLSLNLHHNNCKSASVSCLDWRVLLSDANHIPPSDLSVRKRKLEDALGVNASFDLILGSDLFWDEDMADLVISTIKELLVLSKDSGDARCLLSFIERSVYLREYFMRQAGAMGLQVVEIVVDRPAPVQISARRWTNPQAVYIVEIKLDSEDYN